MKLADIEEFFEELIAERIWPVVSSIVQIALFISAIVWLVRLFT